MSDPQYGPPPPGYGYPPPYPVYAPPTNPMAIAALVCALTIAPVGLGLGIAARKQIRRTGEGGDGLALAGIIIGGIVTGIWVLMIVILIISWIALANYGFGP
ncbi:DUF4190 domain-containing protein [Petropleomorpha daqingensis]|uniref:DUF4190 domain-containing protein n=1 Tax=Petropleomorpha daqingensis TaxID=2026353 RepID=A0A853CHW2_9ACTN|nr:DUF4190 domain-containing protein [Petropleomorpha daqingensis]NYJ06559.1 hypothetical protein [Petropleomorpha daqingensis]